MDLLYEGLRQRLSPQDVALTLIALGVPNLLPEAAAGQLCNLARYSSTLRGTSMARTWNTHPGLARAYLIAVDALHQVTAIAGPAMPDDADPDDPASLTTWVETALRILGLDVTTTSALWPIPRKRVTERTETLEFPPGEIWTNTWQERRRPVGARGQRGGHADQRTGMDAAARRSALPGVSVRTYRRAVRAVLHLQQRTTVLRLERDREQVTRYGKTRLAYTLAREDFTADLATAAFVAYYVARLGERTVFTAGSQDRAMDEVGEGLLVAALASPTSRPDVIARVLTRQSVLRRLDEAQRGQLLALTYEQMLVAGRVLNATFDYHRDRASMVVRRGDDSTTWNAASRAFNQARTGWLNLATALGLAAVVEQSCPGKVPALVASDVAWSHTIVGSGGVHADLAVWAQLPLPWKVVTGEQQCTAAAVREACANAGLDSDATGWTSPYRQDGLATTRPAPELVHGIVVCCPEAASLLRSVGMWSGAL